MLRRDFVKAILATAAAATLSIKEPKYFIGIDTAALADSATNVTVVYGVEGQIIDHVSYKHPEFLTIETVRKFMQIVEKQRLEEQAYYDREVILRDKRNGNSKYTSRS